MYRVFRVPSDIRKWCPVPEASKLEDQDDRLTVQYARSCALCGAVLAGFSDCGSAARVPAVAVLTAAYTAAGPT